MAVASGNQKAVVRFKDSVRENKCYVPICVFFLTN